MTYLKPILPAALLLLFLLQLAHKRGWRRRMGLTVVFVLALSCWRPAAYLGLWSLEAWYPVTLRPAEDAEAIVVLSASINRVFPPTPDWICGPDAYIRVQRAAWLYKNWKPLPVYVSGGRASSGLPTAATVLQEALVAEGVPREAIHKEEESTSTFENAVFTARLLRQQGIRRIALVTHASHMLRSEKAFRKQGIEVVPAPCGFRTARFIAGWRELVPSVSDYRDTEDVLHEWGGLVWYAVSGKF
jgi:uncharacterized SAM-binding protein YcdF (DUF218 family)